MDSQKEPQKDSKIKFSIGYVLVAILVLTLIGQFIVGPLLMGSADISYSEFKTALRQGEIKSVSVSETRITGVRHDDNPFQTVRVEDPDLLAELEAQAVEVHGQVESDGGFLGALLGWILPLALMAGFYYFLMRRMKGGGGTGGMFDFGKSKARRIQGTESGVTFRDVGGAGEAINELREVTDFLRDPERFQSLGGRMPKGVLLVGPPGTGKTLLARATAGEAGGTFFSLSGAEFVEMFVGVGASRVRDLFEQAKKSAPSIIFIDEIDTIGGRRAGVGAVGTHEEREQTLNQLLAEMDGFDATENVIVLAATNRPEILDPALLRPGRFDRQIAVDLPDVVGRREILDIHTRKVPLASDVDLDIFAKITPGFSGADLANVINEAALLAGRRSQSEVQRADLDEAIERVLSGAGHSRRVMSEREKRVVAVHEAGHALVASLLTPADAVHKVTVVPRGRALGYTWQRPSEDRYLMDEEELHSRLAVLLGGRAAEALITNRISTGAADDLAKATDLARRMVTEYGMSSALGPVRLAADEQAMYLGAGSGLDARVSPETAAKVDAETRRVVEEALSKAWEVLDTHRDALTTLADLLYDRETIDGDDVRALLADAAAPVPVV